MLRLLSPSQLNDSVGQELYEIKLSIISNLSSTFSAERSRLPGFPFRDIWVKIRIQAIFSRSYRPSSKQE